MWRPLADFEIAKAQIQKYPISGGNVNPVDLTQMLITEHGLTPNRVAAIELVLSAERATREAIYDTINNKVSPKWLLAFVLADGRLDSARLEGPLDMDLLGLRDKVRLRFEEGRSFFYARVDITTVEGVHHTAESSDVYAWGSFDRTEWLIQHGQETLSTNQLTRLAESIENLEHVADVSAVMAHVTTE